MPFSTSPRASASARACTSSPSTRARTRSGRAFCWTHCWNARPPVVYEDGEQRRDFVHVSDIARAFRLALEQDGADGQAVNIGSGRSTNVLEIAHMLARLLEKDIEPELPGTSRAGDIRHCFAHVSRARELLGFEAQVALEDGLAELAEWLKTQPATDHFAQAAAELAERGLTR